MPKAFKTSISAGIAYAPADAPILVQVAVPLKSTSLEAGSQHPSASTTEPSDNEASTSGRIGGTQSLSEASREAHTPAKSIPRTSQPIPVPGKNKEGTDLVLIH